MEKEKKKHTLDTIGDKLDELGIQLERAQIADYVRLLNNPKRLVRLNILTGIARGVGIAIGFTLFTATILYILQKLGALNLPIIGDYIAEIVRIVQAQLGTGIR